MTLKKYKRSRRLRFGGVSTPLVELRTRDESSDSTLEETVTSIDNNSGVRRSCTRDGSPDLSLEEAVITSAGEPLCTRDESPDSSLEEAAQQRSIEPELESQPPTKVEKKTEINPFFKNVGFVNYKGTEIVVDDEAECEEIARDEVKRAIIQMSKREEKTPIDGWTDKFIRVNHKKCAPVEVLEDRNGRMIYTPLRARQREAGISLGAEIKTPQVS